MENEAQNPPGRADCRGCRYFFVTWQPHLPYGCRAFNMKTRLLPAMVVFQHSKTQCLYFARKILKKGGIQNFKAQQKEVEVVKKKRITPTFEEMG